jgi:hypothetical protein
VEYFSEYLDGQYGDNELNFIEAVDGTEWGVDFRVIDNNIRDEYQNGLVFRQSNPMVDEEWEVGSFMSLTEAVKLAKEAWGDWVEND